MKTSRSLIDPVYPAFRIEEREYPDGKHYDIIWQANGKDEEINILVNKRDLFELYILISGQKLS